MEGDPTEGALITLALKANLKPILEHESLPRTDTIPFESQHRFMATLHHTHTGVAMVLVKGAPETILAMCSREGVASQSTTDCVLLATSSESIGDARAAYLGACG